MLEEKQKELKDILRRIRRRIRIVFLFLLTANIFILTFLIALRPYKIQEVVREINELISNNPEQLFLFILSLCICLGSLLVILLFKKERNSFLDIDDEKVKIDKKIKQAYTENQEDGSRQRIPDNDTFYLYFCSITDYLDTQINAYNKKASILLQDGKAYIRYGIYYYILIIIAWQILLHLYQFDNKYIYGILSTSLLFIFIEFFGGWFLRQYKQFVDTATYLIKIKSILQRYILSYLALKDGKENEIDVTSVISLLQEEIKWPETYLIKKPDINFAKECLETATNLIKSLQDKDKSKEEK